MISEIRFSLNSTLWKKQIAFMSIAGHLLILETAAFTESFFCLEVQDSNLSRAI